MYIIESIKRVDDFFDRIGLTIGNFEGFHRGHLKILNTLISESKRRGLFPSVLTFREHPLKVLKGEEPEKLQAPGDKIEELRREGIEFLIYIDFTKEFAGTEPFDFLLELRKTLSPKLYCLGKGFRFGKGNTGDISLIKKNALLLNYDVTLVDEVNLYGSPISSTRIRKAIISGQMELVTELLGRRYSVYLITDSLKRPRVLHPFIPNTALPKNGSFSGEMESLKTGVKASLTLSLSREITILKEKEEIEEGELYRFYF